MSKLLQANAISYCRAEIDDSVDGKIVFNFRPLIGLQDGINNLFQIPAQRVVIQNTTIYKNMAALATPTDFVWLNSKLGTLQFVTAPSLTDSLSTTFTWTWADDKEIDHYLNRAAEELGYVTYHTDAGDPAFEQHTDSADVVQLPADFPDGLISSLIYLGAYRVASALSSRFAQKYDISAGDKSYSPSQMATAYEAMAERLQKQGLMARDDFYKGQGRQYRPSISTQGYVLPNYTPAR